MVLGFVVLWLYGFIVLWCSGFMLLWLYGCMVLWFYGFMVLLFYGFIVVWLYGFFGFVVSWFYGFVVLWFHGCMDSWFPKITKLSFHAFRKILIPSPRFSRWYSTDLHPFSAPVFSKSSPSFSIWLIPRFEIYKNICLKTFPYFLYVLKYFWHIKINKSGGRGAQKSIDHCILRFWSLT